MEEHLHLVLCDHLVHDHLGGLRINGRQPVLLGIRRFRRVAEDLPELASAKHELLAYAASDKIPLAAPARASCEDDQHHAVREKSAERPIALHEGNFRSCSRGRHCGRKARRTSADDNDVSLVENRQLARWLKDLAVLQEGARNICHRMVEREDVLSEPDVLRITAAALGEFALVWHIFVTESRARRKRRAAKPELL